MLCESLVCALYITEAEYSVDQNSHVVQVIPIVYGNSKS